MSHSLGKAGPPNPILFAGLKSRFVSQSVPSRMLAGQDYTVTMTFENTGSQPWRESLGRRTRLGSQAEADNTIWGRRRVRLPGQTIVRTESMHTFTWTVTAPREPGTYPFQWQMLEEGLRWFGERSPLVEVEVLGASGVGMPFAQRPRHSRTVYLQQGTIAEQPVEEGSISVEIVAGQGPVSVRKDSSDGELIAVVESGREIIDVPETMLYLQSEGACEVSLGPVIHLVPRNGPGVARPLYGQRGINGDEMSTPGLPILSPSEIAHHSAKWYPKPRVPFLLSSLSYVNFNGQVNAQGVNQFEAVTGTGTGTSAILHPIEVSAAIELADGQIIPLFVNGESSTILEVGERVRFEPANVLETLIEDEFWVKTSVTAAFPGAHIPRISGYDNGVRDYRRQTIESQNATGLNRHSEFWSGFNQPLPEPHQARNDYTAAAVIGLPLEPTPLWAVWGNSRRRGRVEVRPSPQPTALVSHYDASDTGMALVPAGIDYVRGSRSGEHFLSIFDPENTQWRSEFMSEADVIVISNFERGSSLEQNLTWIAQQMMQFGAGRTFILTTLEPNVTIPVFDASTLENQTPGSHELTRRRFNAILREEATVTEFGVNQSLSPFQVAKNLGSRLFVADVASAVENVDANLWTGRYRVANAPVASGWVTAATASLITDTTLQGVVPGSHYTFVLKIVEGTGAGQVRPIILNADANPGVRWYVFPSFSVTPDATSRYEVWPVWSDDGIHTNYHGKAAQAAVWRAFLPLAEQVQGP